MAQTELCLCLHGKTNHRTLKRYVNNKHQAIHHECLVDNCNCKEYEKFKQVASNKVNYQPQYENPSSLV